MWKWGSEQVYLGADDEQVDVLDVVDAAAEEAPSPTRVTAPLLSLGAGLAASMAARPTLSSLVPPQHQQHQKRSASSYSTVNNTMMREQARQRCRASPMPRTRVDTNVVCLELGRLTSDAAFATGDPTVCAQCGAFFSIHSMCIGGVWVCEFCAHHNSVTVDEEEIPKNELVDYILEAARAPGVSAATDSLANPLVVFCIDVSGSMGVTTEVTGRHVLRGRKAAAVDTQQYLPHERRDVTYISRLQAVQAAVDAQLELLATQYPSTRVALVTFNNEVRIIGDGSAPAVVVTGDKLQDAEALTREGRSHVPTASIVTARSTLSQRLFDLESDGGTALGPALLVACGIASSSAGSKVILCTDGKANVGLGDLEVSPELLDTVGSFYTNVANTAKTAGTCVSVISIAGTDCRMENIGSVADITQGDVSIVDPLNLISEFANILTLPVLAVQVQAKMILHSVFRFRDVVAEAAARSPAAAAASPATAADAAAPPPSSSSSTAPPTPAPSPLASTAESTSSTKDIGNVNETSKVTFEFCLRDASKLAQLQAEHITAAPFQVQVRFTKPDGMKCIRVITQKRQLTTDRRQAEQTIQSDVLAEAAMENTSALASTGLYEHAHNYLCSANAVLSRASNIDVTNRSIHDRFRAQAATVQTCLEDMVATESNAAEPSPSPLSPAASRHRARERTDEQAKVIFQNRKMM